MLYFNLVVLVTVFGASIIWRPFLIKRLSLIIFAVVTLVFGWFSFLSVRQHQIWQADSFSRHFLPPYHDYSYFAFYVFFRFFLPYLISLVIAAGLYWLMVLANKKFSHRFFEKEEPALAFLAVFLTGYPGGIIYFICIILIYLIWHLIGKFRGEKNIRLSLYYLWLPTAVFVILISRWLGLMPWWDLLKI